MAKKVSIGRGLITEGEDSLKIMAANHWAARSDAYLGRGSISGEDPYWARTLLLTRVHLLLVFTFWAT